MHARVITFPGNHVKEVVKFLNNLDKKGLKEAILLIYGDYIGSAKQAGPCKSA